MKRPASETEQIGTSAIDLFASGMGAFMLIALVFMVLFAATPTKQVPEPPEPTPPVDCPEVPECPECPEPVDCPEVPDCPDPVDCPEVPECPECADCPEVEPKDCPQPVPIPEPIVPEVEPTPAPVTQDPPPPPPPPAPVQTMQLPDTDLVFMVDTTGSMRAEIDTLKRELHLVVEILERMMPSVGIGVVTFNDRRQEPQGRHSNVRQITGDEEAMREIQRFLRSIAVGDARGPNPDPPEAVLAALRVATSSTFRSNVKGPRGCRDHGCLRLRRRSGRDCATGTVVRCGRRATDLHRARPAKRGIPTIS